MGSQKRFLAVWITGHISEDLLHRALPVSEGMDRWNAVPLGPKSGKHPDDTRRTVTDLQHRSAQPHHPRTHPGQRPAAAAGQFLQTVR
jgi:hypothetical protein